MNTFGPDYDPSVDEPALTDQRKRIYALMSDGAWRSLPEIHRLTGFPEASISAQLRHLRKPEFGKHNVTKRLSPHQKRLREYRIVIPDDQGQLLMYPIEEKVRYH